MTRVVPLPRTPHLKKLNFSKARDADPGGGRGLHRDKARQQTRSPGFPRANEESGGRTTAPACPGAWPPRAAPQEPSREACLEHKAARCQIKRFSTVRSLSRRDLPTYSQPWPRRLVLPGSPFGGGGVGGKLIQRERGQSVSAERWVCIFTERLKWPVTSQITYL